MFASLYVCFNMKKKSKRYYLDNIQCVELLVWLEIQYTPNWMACNFIRIRKYERSTLCIFIALTRQFSLVCPAKWISILPFVRSIQWMQPYTVFLWFHFHLQCLLSTGRYCMQSILYRRNLGSFENLLTRTYWLPKYGYAHAHWFKRPERLDAM